MDRDRRRVPRYAFSAGAEVILMGRKIDARVVDLGLCGCRLLASERLATGSPVTVKIRTPVDYFESYAVVAYSTPTDMGLHFKNISSVFFKVLHQWLQEARQNRIEAVPNEAA